ncbi:MAG: hypothetical protein KDA24_02545 [Deltaproteobacteria bacterium]|nr:hypothetical protein [Deltaproteobacteria bacterium]
MKVFIALLVILCAAAHASGASAAPPSSRLTAPEGVLSWTVSITADGVAVSGRSPEWTVEHTAAPDLTPRSTMRTDADGSTVTVVYGPKATTVTLPSKTITHERADLWDADTFDVRLGDRVARRQSTDFAFDALDPASGKVYGFTAETVGEEACGTKACRRVKVRLAGVLKMLGPKWEFWFAPSGQLMRFKGPLGDFVAEGVSR